MSTNWDDYADEWDSNPDVIKYAESAFESLTTYHSLENLRVLDFGCGTGRLTAKIAARARSVLAVDASPKMIDILEKKQLANVKTLVCELSQDAIIQHSLLDNPFDVIVASSVCAFVPDYEQTLADIKSLLNPKGTFIQWDWKRVNGEEAMGFTLQQISQAYTNVGLCPVSVSTPFSLSSETGTLAVIMGMAKNA